MVEVEGQDQEFVKFQVPAGEPWWHYIEEVLVGLVMAAIGVAVTIGVLSRQLGAQPIPWTEPLARYLLIWLTMLGAAVLVKRQGHIVIDFFHGLLPWAGRLIVAVFAYLVELVSFGYLAVYGWQLVRDTTTTTTVPYVSQNMVYAAVPVSAVLMVAYALRNLVSEAKGMRGEAR
jgi:TRAP-type C4-dicarboxylate transport system permease small subunit